MNKNYINKMAKLLIIVGIISSLIVGGAIFVFLIRFIKKIPVNDISTNEETSNIKEESVELLKKHLEEKYGERFFVNPAGKRDTGSFIPGAVNTSPDYYEAYSEKDPDFIFRVYKYSESHSIKQSDEIRDSYCWKFLKEDLKKTIESALTNELPIGYKIFIDTYPDITFDNSLRQDSLLEQYFNRNYNSPIIFINVYTLNSQEEDEKNIEQKVTSLFNEFKNKYNSMNMSFRYYSVENEKDYSLISTKEFESKSLIIYGDNYPEILSKINMQRKFVIKIDNTN